MSRSPTNSDLTDTDLRKGDRVRSTASTASASVLVTAVRSFATREDQLFIVSDDYQEDGNTFQDGGHWVKASKYELAA